MDTTFGVLSLPRGSTRSVERPLTWRIDCLAGRVWLTHDGDPRDVVLDAGESHQPDRDWRLLAEARIRLVPGQT